MSKHARTTLVLDRKPAPPKHSKGWGAGVRVWDQVEGFPRVAPYTPGKHAKPFAKHHPATPVTEATPANVTPLFPAATVLDVAA